MSFWQALANMYGKKQNKESVLYKRAPEWAQSKLEKVFFGVNGEEKWRETTFYLPTCTLN